MRRWNRQVVVGLALVLGCSGVAQAELQQSPNYSVNESFLGGTNSDFTSLSPSYKNVPGVDDSGSTLGDNFVGNSASTNYQAGGGFNTTAQPGLTMIVSTANVSLGTLSTSTASTATAAFSVKNYTSYGYVVQIVGTPPTNSGHALTALTTDTSSATGTEQFGLNVVYNTSPSNPVPGSADPAQVPGASFSYGVAGDGATGVYGSTRPYTQDGKYRFVSGETIASAPKTSGETDYTITFLANRHVTNTPGGTYSGNLSIVATGTY